MATGKKKLANDVVADPVDKDAQKKKGGALPDAQWDHAKKFIQNFVRDNCRNPDGSLWPQRKIAARLGITQPEYNAWMAERARPGPAALIKLRNATNQPIDAILGFALPLPTQQRQAQLDQVIAVADELLRAIRDAGFAPTPSSKLGKLIDKLERAKLAAVGQQHADERLRKLAGAG